MNTNFKTWFNSSFLRHLLFSVSWTVYFLFVRGNRKQWGLPNYAPLSGIYYRSSYIYEKNVWEVSFYILEQTKNIQIYSLLFAHYLVSWFREWEVRVTDSNLFCFGIWESKSPYAVKYHLLQIALSWKKNYLYPFLVWIWIGRVQIAKDTFTLFVTQDSNWLELANATSLIDEWCLPKAWE